MRSAIEVISFQRCEVKTMAVPAARELADAGEQPLHLALDERGGGLVEQQDARAADDDARDLDDLALGERDLARQRARVDMVDAKARQHGLSLGRER